MDRLARNAMLARRAGMSYGKWKALQPIVEVEEKPIPEGWRKCEYCGKPFMRKQGKRFCDFSCRNMAYQAKENEMARERMRKCRERRKEMAKDEF